MRTQEPRRRALLPDARLAHGPIIVGATGGSGTRAVARILRLAGMYTGTALNVSEDAIEFGDYSDRWINRFIPWRDAIVPELEEEMLDDLAAVLERHLRGAGPEPRPWGWKEPRSIFLLPFLHRHMPMLRFLHVVRDGRDMAFSSNQNQLRKHGSVIGLPRPGVAPAAQAIVLWNWLNLETARYGRERLGDRYLRIRFEDLCAHPPSVASRLFEFIGVSGDRESAVEEVAVPESLGRWRAEDPTVVAELERLGGDALAEFGYAGVP